MEELVRILLKWYRKILLLSALAAVLSAFVAFLLPEYYTASNIFIPANPHLMDRTNLFSLQGKDETVYLFGGPNDIYRIFTMAQSRKLENYIIDKFNLYNHYEIDTTDRVAEYWVKEALHSYFKLQKTPQGMVEVAVTDKDPVFAADMANAIVQRLDTLNKEIVFENKRKTLKMYANQKEVKYHELQMLKDSLLSSIKQNPKDTITAKLLKDVIKGVMGEYNTSKIIYEQQLTAVNEPFSTIYVLESAVPPVKRSKPVRWVIVLSATLAAFLAGILYALLAERYKEIKATFNKASEPQHG